MLFGRVELLLGQFGEDVSGVVRLWLDPAYVVPHSTCACIYLKGGRADGDRLTLVPDLDACPAIRDAHPGGVLLDLHSKTDTRMEGSAVGIDTGATLQELSFERLQGPLERILANERSCPGDPVASGVP